MLTPARFPKITLFSDAKIRQFPGGSEHKPNKWPGFQT